MSELPSVIEIAAAIAGVIGVPTFCTWVFSRISKARQLETHNAIHAATRAVKDELMAHMDERIEEVKEAVERVDEDGRETAQKVAKLEGRFEERARAEAERH